MVDRDESLVNKALSEFWFQILYQTTLPLHAIISAL